MGFLDDLKKQASSLRIELDENQQARLRSMQLVEAVARSARTFLFELTSSLDVIRPTPTRRYMLDRQLVLDSPPLTDFRFDARRRLLRNQEVIDQMTMSCVARSARQVVLTKNFVNEIEGLECRLEQAGITFDREAVRNEDNGKLIEMRYAFVADVQISVHVACDHDAECLRFTLRNLDALETVRCAWPPHALTQARLDHLARWWAGEPHRFLDGAVELRRTEAR